jgi:hypothetical protein
MARLFGELSPVNPRARPRAPSAPARRSNQPFLGLLALLLLIYAILGRAGAYIGITLGGGTGIYIGDVVLLVGLGVLILEGTYQRFFRLPVAWPWFLFVTWNMARTLPYLSEYGLLALRDGVLWGYSLFAVIVGSQLTARPSGFVFLLNKYRMLARHYVFWILPMLPVSIFFADGISGFVPPGLVTWLPHVAGAMGFVIGGWVSVSAWWWWALATEVLIIGSQGRGVLLSFVAASAVLWLCNPWAMRRLNVRVIGVLGGLILLVSPALMLNLNLGVSSSGREFGPNQVIENLIGAFGDTGNEALDGTRQWREDFWKAIIDYTVYGPYFWTGKGYGINLAEDAGLPANYKVDNPARAPENSHLSLLARSGVPGLLLWVVLQSTWVVSILRVLLFARRTGRRRTTGLITFFVAYWTVFMLYTSTGPVLESPAGGIWFWTIFGVGAVAARMIRGDPDFFERMELRADVSTLSRSAALLASRDVI